MRISLVCALTLGFLLGAAFKTEPSETLAASLAWDPVVVAIKKSSDALVIGVFLVALLLLANNRTHRVRRTSLAIPLLGMVLVAAVRGLAYSADLGAKLTLGLALFGAVWLSLEAWRGSHSLLELVKEVQRAMLLAAAIVVFFNVFTIVRGFGYLPTSPRFYGTALHPNFLGAQLGICFAIFLSQAHGKRSTVVLNTALASLTVGLIVLTGSRTALLMMLAAGGVILWTRNRSPVARFSLASTIALLSALLMTGSLAPVDIEQFSRGEGGTDTRTRVWSLLFDEFMSSPIIGVGYLATASESSYLRSLATYGLIHGMLLMFVCWALLRSGMSLARSNREEVSSIGVFITCTSFALIVGGFFEGYLVDAYSFPLACIFLLSMISGGRRQHYLRSSS